MAHAVVHKVVYRLDAAPTELEQTFDVPWDADLVAVDWDTRNPLGVALWYRTGQPTGAGVQWRVFVVGTGHEFSPYAAHLATVVRDGVAWHLFDADGDRIKAGGIKAGGE